MKFGLMLPHAGDYASPEALAGVAQMGEQLGYDSLFCFDRLLYPVNPKTPYPGSPDGKLPEATKRFFDPLTTLSYLAGITRKIRLGTGVLVSAFRSPVLAARMASTIDNLSHGRFICGMGMGWSQDEYESSGVPFDTKGTRFDEYLEVMKAVWSQAEPEYHGKYYTVARSILQPQPVQKPMPLWVGGGSDAALKRAVRLGTGWFGSGNMADLLSVATKLRQMAPKDFDIAFWTPFAITEQDTPMSLVGTPATIVSNLRKFQAAGVTEIILFAMQNPQQDIPRFAQELRPQIQTAAV